MNFKFYNLIGSAVLVLGSMGCGTAGVQEAVTRKGSGFMYTKELKGSMESEEALRMGLRQIKKECRIRELGNAILGTRTLEISEDYSMFSMGFSCEGVDDGAE